MRFEHSTCFILLCLWGSIDWATCIVLDERNAVLYDSKSSGTNETLACSDSSARTNGCPPGYDCWEEQEKLLVKLRKNVIVDGVPSSLKDDSFKGEDVYSFFNTLTSSSAFQSHYWQQYPLVLSSNVFPEPSLFTWEADVLSTFQQHKGQFFAPQQASLQDFPHTWIPQQEQDQQLSSFDDITKNTISWEEFQSRVKKQTVHYDEAGAQFVKLGALNRLITHAIGLPTVLNMYISPMGLSTSTPIHTDAQDIFIIPMEGCNKRWRVYAPPPTVWNKDPYNRGKGGDVLHPKHLELLVDVILHPGDVLYIPAGFPHATDTTHISCAYEHSLHLTVGVETHFWALTYAHLRWCLLSRFRMDISNLTVENPAHWKSMNSLPIGIFSPQTPQEQKDYIEDELRIRMRDLEPERWNNEVFPTSHQIQKVISYYLDMHMTTIMALYNEMFHITNEMDLTQLLQRRMRSKQLQHYIMKEFWTFARDEYMLQYYN